MHTKTLLLFDLDGTLLRLHGVGVRAFNRGFWEVMGWPDALSEISPAGMTDPLIAHLVSRKKQGRDMTPEEMEKVFAVYLHCLKTEVEQTPHYEILPGILAFLERSALREDLLLGLGTGNLEAGARLKLARGDLNRFFTFGGFGSDASDRPELLSVAVRRGEKAAACEFSPEQVVVIGDTPLDVAAGKAIGARTLAVATGPFSEEALSACAPDGVVRTFNETEKIEKFF
jgi:phosphoglycolate phosphatase